MKILKIGGILLQNYKNFEIIEKILRLINDNSIIIISAFSKTTRDIEACAKLSLAGSKDEALVLSDNIINFHIDFANNSIKNIDLLNSTLHSISDLKYQFEDIIHAIFITKQLTAKTLDKALCFGEYLASLIFVARLIDSGFKVAELPAKSIIVTDDNYGAAKPIHDLTFDRIKKSVPNLLNNANIIVTQGFIGMSLENRPATMGKESSNLSAALLAVALNADELTIWSDVQGVRGADPSIIKNAKSIPTLSYSAAMNAAINGVKLIYPGMIEALAGEDIPVTFKSAYAPDGEFTEVARKYDCEKAPLIITSLDGFSLINSPKKNTFSILNSLNENLQTGAYVVKITPNSIIAAIPENFTNLLDDFKAAGAEITAAVSAIYVLNATMIDFLRVCSALEAGNFANLLISANYDKFEKSARFFVEQFDKTIITKIIYETLF